MIIMNTKDKIFNLLEKMYGSKIKINLDKINVQDRNPGWKETEDEYQKRQREWLLKIKKRD